MNELLRNGCLYMGLAMIPACQSGAPAGELNLTSTQKPLTVIASIGKTMQKCWFKTGDPAFTKFRLANESNSYAGRPRLLLVPRNNPGGLPSLVVQAEKKSSVTQVQVFGPLLSTNAGQSISNDLKNWAAGKTACKT